MSFQNDLSKKKNNDKISCGYVAIVGRTNVGKSTLLNQILDQKISITTHRPHTTRHRILGIKTAEHSQVIYVDTPGFHLDNKHGLHRYMNRTASRAMQDVDGYIFVVDCREWSLEDEYVLKKIKDQNLPTLLVINKIDRLADKQKLLPYINKVSSKMDFVDMMPLSALSSQYVNVLENKIVSLLPIAKPLFAAQQVSDRSERFFAAEFVREKLMLNLGQELPYALTVVIEDFAKQNNVLHISALIWVEREGQKRIVIGSNGKRLKLVGQQARQDMEKMFASKVYLQLWVKVKAGWSNDERALTHLGYRDDYRI